MLLTLALACAPPPLPEDSAAPSPLSEDSAAAELPLEWYQDYWTPTREICVPPEGWTWAEDWYDKWSLSDECKAQIHRDFKVDREATVELAGGDEEALDLALAALGWLPYAVQPLIGSDYGEVSELRGLDDHQPPLIREPFLERMEQLSEWSGETRAGPLLYSRYHAPQRAMPAQALVGAWPDFPHGLRAHLAPNKS
jgi:hypothetical protein